MEIEYAIVTIDGLNLYAIWDSKNGIWKSTFDTPENVENFLLEYEFITME